MDKALLYRFIGEEVRTSIRRSKYCRVHYEDGALPSPERRTARAERLHRRGRLSARRAGQCPGGVYLTAARGLCIATCRRIEAYNEATAEQTERDQEAYAEQAKYNAQFDAMMAREKICKVRLLPGDVPTHEEPEIVEAALAAPPEEAEGFDFGIDYAALAKHERTIIKHVEI